MSKYGNSYSGNDFLEWWRTHYGTDYDGKSGIVKTEGMTDEDVAIGRSLLNSYNQQQQLTNQYNQNVETETNKYNDLIESSDKAYDSQIAGAKSEYDRNAQLLLENYNRNTANAKEIYDRNTAELLANYGTAQDALDKSKRQSQQNASITLDKLKKYLPAQIKAQGLGGLGVSETSMLQAYNNYNNQMGAIESGYQENKANLDTNYNTNKNAYDTKYQETQGELDSLYGDSKARLDSTFESAKSGFETAKAQASDTYKAQLADELAKLKQGYDAGIYASDKDENGNLLVDNVLKEYKNLLRNERDNAVIVVKDNLALYEEEGNYQGALDYLEANKSLFDNEAEYNALHSRFTNTSKKEKEDQEKFKQEEQQAETDKKILEGKEYVEANGNQYKIKSQLTAEANEISRNNDFKKQLQEKFGTTNPYDAKIPNGTTLEIKCADNGSNDFNFWEDIASGPITTINKVLSGNLASAFYGNIDSWFNWNTRYVTYYNGEWYLSEKK